MDAQHSQTSSYDELIEQEGAVWGQAASDAASNSPPDWRYAKEEPHNAIVNGRYIERLFAMIKPGWRILEVGCSSGAISLEMARRGAIVEGVDVAEKAILIATEYARTNPPTPGSVSYRVADINRESLPTDRYDLIVAIGVVHHLAEVGLVMEKFRSALRPSGLLYIIDSKDTLKLNALAAGGLMMILPTKMPYREKFRHLFRLRGNAVGNMAASIEARGLSPFEGYGRHQDPETQIRTTFEVTSYTNYSAFTGYIVHQLKLPRLALRIVGRLLGTIDTVLVKLRLMRGLNYVLVARPRAKIG